ncbi:MAG TPA: hypothetical protein VGJ51_10325 [Candidatus Angelobacter sp.]
MAIGQRQNQHQKQKQKAKAYRGLTRMSADRKKLKAKSQKPRAKSQLLVLAAFRPNCAALFFHRIFKPATP